MFDVILKMILSSFSKGFSCLNGKYLERLAIALFRRLLHCDRLDNDEHNGSAAHLQPTANSRAALLMNWKKPHKGDVTLSL